MPLDRMLHDLAERGDFGEATVNKLAADRHCQAGLSKETFQERLRGEPADPRNPHRPMPQGGIVTTYTDITERVAAANELARANETLERRVRERTAELTQVNQALAKPSQSRRSESRQDPLSYRRKPRHPAAAQRSAALRTSLVECELRREAQLVRNIDGSLQAVEEILTF